MEVGPARFVFARREMLRHEWRVHADEMRTSQSSAYRKIQFCAPAEALIKAVKAPECFSPAHERAASEHAPTMTPIILHKTEHIIGDDGTIGLRGLTAYTETSKFDSLSARRHDIAIRVAQYRCARVHRLVVANAPILLAHAIRHAFVVVVKEGNERPARLRQKGVQRGWKAPIGPVAHHAYLWVCSREPLQDAITSIRRSIIDDDDLPHWPSLHQRALHRAANGLASVVASDTKCDKRLVHRDGILWK
jgi:hypothetical protein